MDDEDIVVITSDSEDDEVPPQERPSSCKPSTSAQARARAQALTLSEDSRSSSATSQLQIAEERRKAQAIARLFPFAQNIEQRLRESFGTNHSQKRVMNILSSYIIVLKEAIENYPKKCRILSKTVCRNLFLFKLLSKHFCHSPYYLHKISQLLSLYVYMELINAERFKDSKTRIAERIISNIHLHLKSVDMSYTLRMICNIPDIGKNNEIAAKMFKRILPEPIVTIKHEFPDRIYILYLMAFYLWKEAEPNYEDEQKLVTFANGYMKPMHSLKSNSRYARNLPCYEKREDATGYFLTNMVFFNDLRHSVQMDGVMVNMPDNVIDLSDELDMLSIICEEITDDDPPMDDANDIDESIELDDEPPWLQRLVRRAIELEVRLPAHLAGNLNNSDVIDLASSDDDAIDEHWAYNEEELVEKETNSVHNNKGEAQQNGEPYYNAANETNPAAIPSQELNSVDMFPDICRQLDTSIDLPDDSSDGLLKQITQEKQLPKKETNSSNVARLTFQGITENELNCLPSSSSQLTSSLASTSCSPSTSSSPSTSTMVIAENAVPIESVEKIVNNKPNSGETTESSSVVDPVSEPEPTIPEIISSIETDVIEKATTQQSESNEDVLFNETQSNGIEGNNTMVANILADFADVATSLNSDSSDEGVDLRVEEEFSSQNNIDDTQVQKEAVTLSLNTYTGRFESSEESNKASKALESHVKPAIKTYLRKDFQICNKTVDIENNNSKSDAGSSQEIRSKGKRGAAKEDTPNILFSGKVIPLGEDDNAIGSLTPSYLKVPESVEVSSQGSNVVFSMQGRRLSSFPSLLVTSPNEQTMPDFDGDFFNLAEETIADSGKKTETTETTSSVQTNDKSKKHVENEKPTSSRRSVWWSDKNEIRVIPSRDAQSTTSSECSQSTINSITTTINKINSTKKQFQLSTIQPSTQPDINVNKIRSNSPTIISKRTNISTATTTTNTIITNATSSPDTAALKSAQEQDLVQRLFPELFAKASKQQNRNKVSKTTNVVKAQTKTKKIKHSISNSNAAITYNPTHIDTRCKSVTPTPSGSKQALSEFDRYLANLEKKRTKCITQPIIDLTKKRERRRRSRKNPKLSVDVTTTQFVDTPYNDKLKKKPIVIVERLLETEFRAKEKSMTIDTSLSLLRATATKEKCTELTPTVSSTEYLCAIPGQETPTRIKTHANVSTVTAAVEQEESVPPLMVETSLESVLPTQQVKSVQTPPQIVEKNLPEATVELPPPEQEKIQLETELKPQVHLISIKIEEPDTDVSTTENFKRPIRSYGGASSRREYKASPARTITSSEVSGVSTESVADRLLAVENKRKKLGKNPPLPPNKTESTDSLSESTSETFSLQQAEPYNANITQTKEVIVKLKRWNLDKYVVVKNTAVDDLIREGKDPRQVQLDVVNVHNHDEKRHRKEKQKKGSAARKREAMKRIYHETIQQSNILFLGTRNRRTCGENNHLLTINTPPPTPPSPSLSPAPRSIDTNPTTDDTSQDGSEMASRRSKTEPNNNHVRPTFPPLSNQNRPPAELSKYISSTSDRVQEICDHSNIKVYYKDLKKHKDGRAKEEMNKVLPLFETRLFPGPSVSYSSPALDQQRSHKSTSRTAGCSSKSSKRRKTMDFVCDEAICSSPKATDSPTLEVMRLHTADRSVLFKPLALPATVSSTAIAEEYEKQIEEEGDTGTPTISHDRIRSPNLFSECSTSSVVTMPVQLEFSLENPEEECERSSSLSRRTNCDSPPAMPSRIGVSRTYSKSNMVQHVFVPPEIEKCIEEQSSAVVVVEKYEGPSATSITLALPSTSKKHGNKTRRSSGRKTRKIPKYFIDNNTSDDDDNKHNKDTDDMYRVDDVKGEEEEKNEEMNVVPTISVKRSRRKSKTSHRRKKLKKH